MSGRGGSKDDGDSSGVTFLLFFLPLSFLLSFVSENFFRIFSGMYWIWLHCMGCILGALGCTMGLDL